MKNHWQGKGEELRTFKWCSDLHAAAVAASFVLIIAHRANTLCESSSTACISEGVNKHLSSHTLDDCLFLTFGFPVEPTTHFLVSLESSVEDMQIPPVSQESIWSKHQKINSH